MPSRTSTVGGIAPKVRPASPLSEDRVDEPLSALSTFMVATGDYRPSAGASLSSTLVRHGRMDLVSSFRSSMTIGAVLATIGAGVCVVVASPHFTRPPDDPARDRLEVR